MNSVLSMADLKCRDDDCFDEFVFEVCFADTVASWPWTPGIHGTRCHPKYAAGPCGWTAQASVWWIPDGIILLGCFGRIALILFVFLESQWLKLISVYLYEFLLHCVLSLRSQMLNLEDQIASFQASSVLLWLGIFGRSCSLLQKCLISLKCDPWAWPASIPQCSKRLSSLPSTVAQMGPSLDTVGHKLQFYHSNRRPHCPSTNPWQCNLLPHQRSYNCTHVLPFSAFPISSLEFWMTQVELVWESPGLYHLKRYFTGSSEELVTLISVWSIRFLFSRSQQIVEFGCIWISSKNHFVLISVSSGLTATELANWCYWRVQQVLCRHVHYHYLPYLGHIQVHLTWSSRS